jgi:hypothetical protein
MDRNDFIEISNLMANGGSAMVHYVQIEYKNGKQYEGFFSRIDHNIFPPRITFQDRIEIHGNSSEHIIDWNNVKTLIIKMHKETDERIYQN